MTARRILIAAVLLAVAIPATASARWQAGAGSGAGYAKARQLAAGLQPTANVSGRNVTVSWSAPGGSVPLDGYLVKRYASGGASQPVGSSCQGLIAATGCTEQAVAPGSWRYTITPATANWRGAESPQSAAIVVAPPSLTLSQSTVSTLPSTLSGQIASFISGQTVSFRLDNPVSGPALSGNITPSPVPGGGTSTVAVTLPAGTSAGTHSVYAIGSSGDTAAAQVTVPTPQTLLTTAWQLADASGGSEVDASDEIAFADGRTIATKKPANTFEVGRYLLIDYNGPLPTNATPASASFQFRFASESSNSTACFYFDVRRSSTDAVLATHGSDANPIGCNSTGIQQSFSTSLPEVTSRAIANDLRVRAYITDSKKKGPDIDEATISVSSSQGPFTLHDRAFLDEVGGGTTVNTWPLVEPGDPTYRSESNWSSAFDPARYLLVTFPTYVPAAGTVTGASFSHSYRANGGGTVCWYLEVLRGATVIGTHGSPGSPISCNSSGSAYVDDTVSLPEVNSPTRANGVAVKIYMRNSSSRRSQTDWAELRVDYTN